MIKSHNRTSHETLGRNPIHPFPARMAPGIALDALGESTTQLRVLDPMTGSGTVLAVARAKGHRAFGIDLDPLAVLLATVWTRTIDAKHVKDEAAHVLARAKATCDSIASSDAYPQGSDDETRNFIKFWFDDLSRRQLTSLSMAINEVRCKAHCQALWCAFSRLIISKQSGASLARDLSHSRPHKFFSQAPIRPFEKFIEATNKVVSNCPQANTEHVGPVTVVKLGDARKLPLQKESIDLVLTSPPYLNAIDYMRCSKFSLVWMGYNINKLREIRAESVGSEVSSEEALDTEWVRSLINDLKLTPKLSPRNNALLAHYAWDMGQALAEASRVLKKNGRAVYVVGDSTVRGTFVRNSAIVSAVAKTHGLSLVSQQSRQLPANRRYLPPPCRLESDGALSSRMREEVVLVFNK